MILNKELFDYQETAVNNLSQNLASAISKKLRTKGFPEYYCLQAPTGSGKTIMIAETIRRLGDTEEGILQNYNVSTGADFLGLMFVVVAPNSLHKQFSDSLKDSGLEEGGIFKLKELNEVVNKPHSLDVNDVLVLNYASFNKENNRSRLFNERDSNLEKQFESLRERNIFPVVIPDEAHIAFESNNSKDFFRNVVQPIVYATVTATPELKKGVVVSGAETPQTLTQVNRQSVVDSGVIVETVYVNDGIKNYASFTDFSGNDLYVYSAIEQAKKMAAEYKEEGSKVKPLAAIQLPSKAKDPLDASQAEIQKDDKEQKEDIRKVLEFLKEQYDWSIESGEVAVYTADRRENLDNIENNTNDVKVIIFKAAIAVGWDCPRLKTMALLRNSKSHPFTIQTVGRSMRQPERKKYENSFLNNSYIYTGNDLTKNLVYAHSGEVKKKVEIERKTVGTLDKHKGISTYNRTLTEDYYIKKDEVKDALAKVLKRRGYDLSKMYTSTIDQKVDLLKALEFNDGSSRETSVVFTGKIEEQEGFTEEKEQVINAKSDINDLEIEYGNLIVEAVKNSKAISHTNTARGLKDVWRYSILGAPDNKKTIKSTAKVFEDTDFMMRTLANKENETAFLNFLVETINQAVEDTNKTSSKTKVCLSDKKWKPLEKISENYKDTIEDELIENEDYLYELIPKDLGSKPENIFVEKVINSIKEKTETYFGKGNVDDVKFYKNGTINKEHHSIKYIDVGKEERQFFPDFYIFIQSKGELYWLIIETKGKKDLWNQENDIQEKVEALEEFVQKEQKSGLKIHGTIMNFPETNKERVQIADNYKDNTNLSITTIENAVEDMLGKLARL